MEFKKGDIVWRARLGLKSSGVTVDSAVVVSAGVTRIRIDYSSGYGYAFEWRSDYIRSTAADLLSPTREEALRRLEAQCLNTIACAQRDLQAVRNAMR